MSAVERLIEKEFRQETDDAPACKRKPPIGSVPQSDLIGRVSHFLSTADRQQPPAVGSDPVIKRLSDLEGAASAGTMSMPWDNPADIAERASDSDSESDSTSEFAVEMTLGAGVFDVGDSQTEEVLASNSAIAVVDGASSQTDSTEPPLIEEVDTPHSD